MDSITLARVRDLVAAGKPIPPVEADWLLDQLARCPAGFDERDRLIHHHAKRLGNGRLHRGCERLLEYLQAEHDSVRDLLELDCDIPKLRRMYAIVKERDEREKKRLAAQRCSF